MGIKQKIRLGFFALGLLLFFSGLMSYFELNKLSHSTRDMLDASLKNMELSKEMLDAVQACLRPASCSSSTTCLPTSAPLPLFDVGLPTTATVAFTHDVSLILQYDNRDSLHTPHANGFPYKWPCFVERMFLYVERSLFTKRDFPHNVPFRTTLIRRQSAPPVTVCRHAIRMAFACRPALRPAHPRLLSCRIRSSHYCRI